MPITVNLSKSKREGKKYTAIIYENNVKKKTIHFGASRYTDFTRGATSEQRSQYIQRHKKNEDWGRSGIFSSGFWSRWLLWEKTTLTDAIKNIERKFNIDIKYK